MEKNVSSGLERNEMDAAGAIGVKLGIEAVTRVVPRGITWLMTYASGIELLILGPGGAGKTSFYEYLRFGTLEKVGKHEKTYDIEYSPTFSIRMGRDGALNLKVRRTVDTPGQVGPVRHANLVGKRKPQVIMIMLDGSKAASTAKKWLNEFGTRLDEIMRSKPSISRRLKLFLVVINKKDKIKPSAKQRELEKAVRSALRTSLRDVLGTARTRRIPILPCISVLHKDAPGMLDTVIRRIAKSAAG